MQVNTYLNYLKQHLLVIPETTTITITTANTNTTTTEAPITTIQKCPKPNWIGDGYCDDETNIPKCNYDGGDCCGDSVDKSRCKVCKCSTISDTNTTKTQGTL